MQKYVNIVDLVKSEELSNDDFLAKSASIQPRTSPSKIGGDSTHLSIRLLRGDREAARSDRRGRDGRKQAGFTNQKSPALTFAAPVATGRPEHQSILEPRMSIVNVLGYPTSESFPSIFRCSAFRLWFTRSTASLSACC